MRRICGCCDGRDCVVVVVVVAAAVVVVVVAVVCGSGMDDADVVDSVSNCWSAVLLLLDVCSG